MSIIKNEILSHFTPKGHICLPANRDTTLADLKHVIPGPIIK